MSLGTLLIYQPPEIRHALIDSTFGWYGPVGTYRISDQGVLESSIKRIGFHKHDISDEWKVRSLYPDKDGYLFANLCFKGHRKTCYAHKCVAHYFCPGWQPGLEACHNNPDRTDNRAVSLRWDDHESNLRDMLAHDTHRRGERSHTAKLTLEQVRAIRARGSYRSLLGGYIAVLAKENNVSENTIRRVLQHDTWIESESDQEGRSDGSRNRAVPEHRQDGVAS